MDNETLIFLLKGGHMNIPDRISRGLWPHPPIPFHTCVNAIVAYLAENEWFPYEWHQPKPGELVDEGITIQKLSDGRFLCRAQASHPINPGLLHSASERIFKSAEDATLFYLRWHLGLTRGLDGWKVAGYEEFAKRIEQCSRTPCTKTS